MRAGLMRDRVSLYQPVETQSPTGQPLTDWQEAGNTWVEIVPKRGTEEQLQAFVQADADHRMTMRLNPLTLQMTPKWRLQDQRDTVYDIKEILPDHKRELLSVLAKRRY